MTLTQLGQLISVWILAVLLIGISFILNESFWVLFPISMAILIIIAHKSKQSYVNNRICISQYLIGILSGVLLYSIFLIAYILIKHTFPMFLPAVHDLYIIVGPKVWWHFVLLLLIIPGEELFWRGYIQRRVIQMYKRPIGIFVATALYAVAHISSGNAMLVLAALFSGIVWGALYEWKKSITVVILSHFTFNLFLLILYPLTF